MIDQNVYVYLLTRQGESEMGNLCYFPLKKPDRRQKNWEKSAKEPAIINWQEKSTDEKPIINSWLKKGHGVGIDCGKSGLVVLDVDHTDMAEGMWEFELLYPELPKTRIARTQGGKYHLYFWGKTKNSVKNNNGFEHVDIRSVGGYVVAPPSKIANKYEWVNNLPIADAPEWLIEELGKPNKKRRTDNEEPKIDLDSQSNIDSAMEYLKDAPVSIENEGGNNNAYNVAAQLHEYGLSPQKIAECMDESGWNDHCEPPWDFDELLTFAENAANYAVNDVGSATAEYQFKDVVLEDKKDDKEIGSLETQIIDSINKKFAVVHDNSGVEIYNFHTCPEDGEIIRKLSKKDFKLLFENKLVTLPDRKKAIDFGTLWLSHKNRRTYNGTIFDPKFEPLGNKHNHLNLWRGYSFEPKEGDCSYLNLLIKRAVCGFNQGAHEYLLNWVAFLLQNPNAPAEVAVVVRGPKGAGKSTLGRTIKEILIHHSFVVNSPELLAGRFQGHLRNKLFLLAEESFWAGDKRAGNRLKNMITDGHVPIEEKGKTAEILKNRMSIMMTSNEDWVVEASMGDERRYFVLDITNEYLGDFKFFIKLYDQLENGGHEAFLYEMLNRDISGWHPRNNIPQTEALRKQKKKSMTYVQKWWDEMIDEGELCYPANEIDNDWSEESIKVPKTDLFDSFREFVYDRMGKRYRGSKIEFKKSISDFGVVEKQSGDKKTRGQRFFVIPKLEEARNIFNDLF